MLCSMAASFVDGTLSIRYETRNHVNLTDKESLSLFIPLLFTNVVATSLVGWKFWQCRRDIAASISHDDGAMVNRSAVVRVLTLLVESGFLYILYWIITMASALSILGGLADGIFECILPQVAGIYLSVVILVVSLQNPSNPSASILTTTGVEGYPSGAMRFASAHNSAGTRLFGTRGMNSTGRGPGAPCIGPSFVEKVEGLGRMGLEESEQGSGEGLGAKTSM
ncbi:uncharacterized protein STEHIDRAFT_109629 [Stereum hirsutum FP-91666 SS1]|uniref:uncharacterized protein n=1 Tax=Stereum hirsutum (strain FP-91666) TaxID=721885 RepID=UPI000440E3CD|nr:uncharacterized protein STEHIDRAFT_109629 [Stereum hirsutum FP-91666 SS1]EIM87737.1 hypothetical protein STEHIDRAFT_109629 [Stereum hirsutum FP-91666 SS1]